MNACKKVIQYINDGTIDIASLDENLFSSCLYTGRDPDPDLIIRTSGEQRISNFLLWQGAYSELVFVDLLWPDFNERALRSAIAEYQNRDRRFGALK